MTALPDFRTSRWAPLAALLTTSVLLTACGSGSTGSGSGSSRPQSGGTLTFAVGSDAGCVDPQQVGSNESIYSVRQTVDSLTDQNPETGKIVPWLAKSWDINADATEFTFHLRSGVTFSDGSELTAQVVKDNFDAVPKLGALGVLAQGYLSSVKSTAAVDPLTVKVTFKEPNAQFLQATSTHSLGIESSASVKKTPQQKCSDGVVGTGPFVLKQYVQNQSITLANRTGYDWGSSLWSKKGEAYLDKLVFKVVPEAGVRAGSLQSGQVDAISSVGKANEAALKGGQVTLLRRADPGVVFGLGINNSRLPSRTRRCAGRSSPPSTASRSPTRCSRPAPSRRPASWRTPRPTTPISPRTSSSMRPRPSPCWTRPVGRPTATASASRTARS